MMSSVGLGSGNFNPWMLPEFNPKASGKQNPYRLNPPRNPVGKVRRESMLWTLIFWRLLTGIIIPSLSRCPGNVPAKFGESCPREIPGLVPDVQRMTWRLSSLNVGPGKALVNISAIMASVGICANSRVSSPTLSRI